MVYNGKNCYLVGEEKGLVMVGSDMGKLCSWPHSVVTEPVEQEIIEPWFITCLEI